MKNLKKRLLNDETIDLANEENVFSLWFQSKTNNFCLMMNAKIIKSTKTFKPILNKLSEFENLEEIEL